LAPGSVTRTIPIPGLEEKARGFKTLAEALYLRDHILKQQDLPNTSDDEAERRARLTFVVVGAGYAGTEFAAQAQLFAKKAIHNYPSLRPGEMSWLLVDIAPKILPELGEHLGEVSLRLLSKRGIEIRLGTSIENATEEGLTLSDGTFVPTHTPVWCAGVVASPLVSTLGLPLDRGRLVVDLGGKEAAAKPLGIGLSGVVDKAVTRAYHLYALSSTPQRVRVGLDWILDAVLPRPLVRLGIGKEEDAPLAAAERTGIYEDLGQRLTRG
jgi:NADH dehydrogenase FAD-containing subunit